MLKKLKEANLKARKNKETVVAVLLSTIIGEAEMVGKNACRATTDKDVMDTLRTFEKNQVANIRCYSEHENKDAVAIAENELKIIRLFLPAKLTDLQVENDITGVMQDKGLAKEMKSLGAINSVLREKYGDQFEGGQISSVFKRILM